MKKSILFLMDYSVLGKSRRKFDDQMDACRNIGLDVWVIGVDDTSVYLCHGDKKTFLRKQIKSPIAAAAENFRYISIYSAVKRALEIKNDFTYCYIRRYFHDSQCLDAVKRLEKAGTKTVIEIPTFPPQKELDAVINLKRRLMGAFNMHYEKKVARHIKLYCPMGEHAESYLGTPAFNIENGIGVKNIRLRVPKFREGEYHILALAYMSYWHGYDRIIRGLADYYKAGGKMNVILHLVGGNLEGGLDVLGDWKKLAEELKVENHVSFDGWKNSDELNELFDEYDLGAACLAKYRCGMDDIFELKTREYMAHGLPFIYSLNDYVLDDFGKYCIKIPNKEVNVDINEMIRFADEMRADSEVPAKMRKFAQENMGFESIFKRVFDNLDNM